MAQTYAASVQADSKHGYKLQVTSCQGTTWDVSKDRASILAFHERATRLGATNGVPFSTAPAELEAYLADIVQHATSSGAKAMLDVFFDAEAEELGPEEAFVDQIVKLVPDTDAGEQLAERFAQYVSTRNASTDSAVVLQDARDQACLEAKEALSRKTASILKAVRRTCDEHRRDRDRILGESAASVAAATREVLSEREKFDGMEKLAMGAIQSAEGRANKECVRRLTNENEALREELNAVVRRGVSDFSNSSTKNNPFPYEQQVVTSSSGSGSGSYGSGGDSSGGNESSEDGYVPKISVDSMVEETIESHGRDGMLAKRLVAAEERERSLLHHILELRATLMEQGGTLPPLPPTLPARLPRATPREVDDDVEDAKGDLSS